MLDIQQIDLETLNGLSGVSKLGLANRTAAQLVFVPLLLRALEMGLEKSIEKHNFSWAPLAIGTEDFAITTATLDDNYAKIYRDIAYKLFNDLEYTRKDLSIRRSYSTISIYTNEPSLLWLNACRPPHNQHAKSSKYPAIDTIAMNNLRQQLQTGLGGTEGQHSYRTYVTNAGLFAVSFGMAFSNIRYNQQQYNLAAVNPLTILDNLKAFIKPARDLYSKFESAHKDWLDKRMEELSKQALPLTYDRGATFYWVPTQLIDKYGPIPCVTNAWDPWKTNSDVRGG